MNLRLVLVMLVALSFAMVDVAPAQAQYGAYGGCGYGFGGAWDVGRLYSVLAQNVPYYSAFPPVYYSAPVPRTYGYSPFAYPPGYSTPDIASEAPKALEISNPYVAPAASSESQEQVDKVTDNRGPQPQLVVNPYVVDMVAIQ